MKQNIFETEDSVYCSKCKDWTSLTIEVDEDDLPGYYCSECGSAEISETETEDEDNED